MCAYFPGAQAAFAGTSMARSAACDSLDWSGLTFVDGPVDHFGNAELVNQTPIPNYRASKELSLEKQYRNTFCKQTSSTKPNRPSPADPYVAVY